MRDNGILDTINTLIATDPACMDRSGVREVMAKIRHVQGWASAGLLECSRRLEELSEASNPGADASFALAGAMDQTNAEASSTVDQASLCDTNRDLEDSLAAGEITSRHLATIARYRSRLEPHERSDFDLELPRVHRWAREQHFKMFEQSLRDLVALIKHRHHPVDEMAELDKQRAASKLKTWVEQDTGLHHVLLTMDPVRAAKFTSAYQAELAALRAARQDRREPFGSLQVQAVINALGGASGTPADNPKTPARPTETDRNVDSLVTPGAATSRSSELIVVVDHNTLTNGRHEHTICETIDGAPLPVPFVRELCQDAIINLFALDELGNICAAIDERTANRAQRRALAAMYRSCSFPNCTVPFSQTRMHHIHYSRDDGKTQLCNLIPICETHHHHIHDLGWTLTMEPTTRCATFTEPGAQFDIGRGGVADRGQPIHRTRPDRTSTQGSTNPASAPAPGCRPSDPKRDRHNPQRTRRTHRSNNGGGETGEVPDNELIGNGASPTLSSPDDNTPPNTTPPTLF